MGRADFFVRRKKRDSPKHSPHLARLSSFSSFFQIILWRKALAALYLRNPKQWVGVN
jgi:hypothetical protein